MRVKDEMNILLLEKENEIDKLNEMIWETEEYLKNEIDLNDQIMMKMNSRIKSDL